MLKYIKYGMPAEQTCGKIKLSKKFETDLFGALWICLHFWAGLFSTLKRKSDFF
jgi:hypothetical protein